jgi:menaquinone-dependent protoporphyrinogen IX oxidase
MNQSPRALIVYSTSKGTSEELPKYVKLLWRTEYLKPVAMGLFGGVLNYNKMRLLTRKNMEVAFKSRLQNNGFKEAEPGIYDLRDRDEIRSWARELAKNARK